jgi:hypothetical protein
VARSPIPLTVTVGRSIEISTLFTLFAASVDHAFDFFLTRVATGLQEGLSWRIKSRANVQVLLARLLPNVQELSTPEVWRRGIGRETMPDVVRDFSEGEATSSGRTWGSVRLRHPGPPLVATCRVIHSSV